MKVKKCEQTLLFIVMHYRGYMSWRSKVGPPSLPSYHISPATRDSDLHLGWNASLKVSSGCAGSLSPTAPVLYHGPLLWFSPSGSGGGPSMHGLLQPSSPLSPSHKHLNVPLVLSLVSVWSLRCKCGHSCRGYDIPHWIAYQEVMHLSPWSTFGEFALMLKFLQTHLMSSLIPVT